MCDVTVNPYEILGVDAAGCNADRIRSAFHKRSVRWYNHDTNFYNVALSYCILKTEDLREVCVAL